MLTVGRSGVSVYIAPRVMTLAMHFCLPFRLQKLIFAAEELTRIRSDLSNHVLPDYHHQQ